MRTTMLIYLGISKASDPHGNARNVTLALAVYTSGIGKDIDDK